MKRVAQGGRASHKTPMSGGRAEKTEKVEAEGLRGVVEHTVHRREVMATKKGPEVRRVLGSSHFEQDGVDVSLDRSRWLSLCAPPNFKPNP